MTLDDLAPGARLLVRMLASGRSMPGSPVGGMEGPQRRLPG